MHLHTGSLNAVPSAYAWLVYIPRSTHELMHTHVLRRPQSSLYAVLYHIFMAGLHVIEPFGMGCAQAFTQRGLKAAEMMS